MARPAIPKRGPRTDDDNEGAYRKALNDSLAYRVSKARPASVPKGKSAFRREVEGLASTARDIAQKGGVAVERVKEGFRKIKKFTR